MSEDGDREECEACDGTGVGPQSVEAIRRDVVLVISVCPVCQGSGWKPKPENKEEAFMKMETIRNHVASLSAEARADIASGAWDEVMADALYAACGAETVEEMNEARSVAEVVADK